MSQLKPRYEVSGGDPGFRRVILQGLQWWTWALDGCRHDNGLDVLGEAWVVCDRILRGGEGLDDNNTGHSPNCSQGPHFACVDFNS